MHINSKENKEKIAIVVVGYNRQNSIRRLLASLSQAEYPKDTDVPLVISIDCSNNQELYQYVNDFEWPFGEKYVNIQTERLGLKKHILQCGDLTKYFKAIVLFEDDIYAGRYFYDYVKQAVDYYYDDDNIAQISLYNSEVNCYVNLPFSPVNNGYDAYASQDVSTWGECWTDKMWYQFRLWLDHQSDFSLEKYDVPQPMRSWTRAWSIYFIAYILESNKYVLTPYISHSTNFGDAGEHSDTSNNFVQVNLMDGERDYSWGSFADMVKYELFYNNIDIYNWLGMTPSELSLDLYNFRKGCRHKRFVLTTAKLPYTVVKSFGLQLRPLELNIKERIEGHGIYLYDTESEENELKNGGHDTVFIEYLLHGFSGKELLKYEIAKIKIFLSKRFKKIRK